MPDNPQSQQQSSDVPQLDNRQPTIAINDTLLKNISFQPSEQVLFRQVDSEAVLLHVTNGSYYSLNNTSLPFWEAIQEQQPLATAIDRVTDEYDVERSQVLGDLQTFLQQLLEYELIAEATADAR